MIKSAVIHAITVGLVASALSFGTMTGGAMAGPRSVGLATGSAGVDGHGLLLPVHDRWNDDRGENRHARRDDDRRDDRFDRRHDRERHERDRHDRDRHDRDRHDNDDDQALLFVALFGGILLGTLLEQANNQHDHDDYDDDGRW